MSYDPLKLLDRSTMDDQGGRTLVYDEATGESEFRLPCLHCCVSVAVEREEFEACSYTECPRCVALKEAWAKRHR